MVRAAWLGLGSIRLGELCKFGLNFVLDYCPDIVLLQTINNDLDSSGTIA